METFFEKNFAGQFLVNEPMRNHTSLKIGGLTRILFLPKKISDVQSVINFCREQGIKFFLMGNGTNLLVDDNGFDGVIIKLNRDMSSVTVKDTEIEAESGIFLSRLAKIALANNLSGLEFASGIPGTLGGAICMNAGAYGNEIKNVFLSAQILHEGKIKTFTDLKFGYRKSLIDENYVVLSAKIKLQYGDHDEILHKMNEYAQKRKASQPLEFPNAGSTFKRANNISAGKLIMDAGLANYRVGDACVSKKHCGFIINLGRATSKDVLNLIEHVKSVVYNKFNIVLEPEIKFLN